VIPVLEQGEIYIRFGPAVGPLLPGLVAATDSAGALIDEPTLRAWIREEMERADIGVRDEDLRALEDRIVQRLGVLRPQPTPQPEAQRVDVTTRVQEGEPRRELRGCTGLTVAEPSQLVLGLATNIGPMSPGSRVDLVPHFALGVGEGRPSYLLGLSLEYALPEFSAGGPLRLEPLVSLSPSIFRGEETRVRLGTFTGTGIRILESGDQKFHLLAGYQGIDLFGQGRFISGVRILR
jgi:hypothetical protein